MARVAASFRHVHPKSRLTLRATFQTTASARTRSWSRPSVVVAGNLDHASNEWRRWVTLEYDVWHLSQLCKTRDAFVNQLKNARDVKRAGRQASCAEYGATSPPSQTAVNVLSRMHALLFINFELLHRVDASMIEAMPDTVRLIAVGASGYDNVDLQAASARGMCVSNVPGGARHATADIALHLLLSATRRTRAAEQQLRSGKWPVAAAHHGMNIRKSTLGILGFGHTGQALAKRVKPLGFQRVVYHCRNRMPRTDGTYTDPVQEMSAH